MAMRIGPRMSRVVDVVRSNPGCAKIVPARAVAPNGSLMYGYQSVNRAIRAGLIRSERKGNRYALYTV